MILRLQVDEYDEDSPVLNVRISLKESGYANASARKYRASSEKHKRRLKRRRALKAAEESAQRQLADAQKRGKQLVTVSSANHWSIIGSSRPIIYLVLRTMRIKTNNSSSDTRTETPLPRTCTVLSCVLRLKRRRLKTKDGTVPLLDQALAKLETLLFAIHRRGPAR
jgi:hypothetical protein